MDSLASVCLLLGALPPALSYIHNHEVVQSNASNYRSKKIELLKYNMRYAVELVVYHKPMRAYNYT